MADLGAVTKRIVALAGEAMDDVRLARELCDACVDGLDVDGAAVSLLTATASGRTLWATDPVAEILEDLQFSLNEGACVEAATTGFPVLVPDLRDGTETARWPVFASAIAEQTGVTALFALPLQWGAHNLGVLDLYRLLPGTLSNSQWRDVLAATETAVLLLVGHRTRHPSTDADGGQRQYDDGWLDTSRFARPEIHQATGMVLAQLDIGPEEALARMRAHAFAEQRLLIDIARDVVARRLRFTEEMR